MLKVDIHQGTSPNYWLYCVWKDGACVASGWRKTQELAQEAATIVVKSLRRGRRA